MVDIFIWPDLYSDYSFWNQNLLLFITIGIFFLSLIATKQNKITRLLAYSSAANSSILLLAFLSEPQLTKTTLSTVFLYYIMYIVNTICIFLILKFIKKLGLPSINKSTDIRDLQNFYLNFPLPAIFLIFLLLSVGGVPPLIGFITKFNLLKIIFFSLNDISMFFFVTSFVILSSVLLLFCYLRIVSSIIKGNTEFIKNKISLNSFKNLPNKIRILLIANFSFNVFVIFHIDEIIFILSNL
jgi:NADH-quinone oxidoreductase subunit N